MADEIQPLRCRPDVAAFVPLSIAREMGIFPLDVSTTSLTFAVEAPLSHLDRDRLVFVFNREIREVVHPRAAIQEAIASQLEGLVSEEDSDDDAVCWLWPHWNHVRPDGTMVIKCSGWHEQCHWSGAREVPPQALDYAFYQWLVAEPEYARLVDERELPEIRRRWERLTGIDT